MLQNFLKCFSFNEEQDLPSDNSESISSNELSSSDNDTENHTLNNFGLPIKPVLSHHRQIDHTQYERFYKWLYFSHLKNCKICVKCVLSFKVIALA